MAGTKGRARLRAALASSEENAALDSCSVPGKAPRACSAEDGSWGVDAKGWFSPGKGGSADWGASARSGLGGSCPRVTTTSGWLGTVGEVASAGLVAVVGVETGGEEAFGDGSAAGDGGCRRLPAAA